MLHEKDNGPHPDYNEVVDAAKFSLNVCDYPGCSNKSAFRMVIDVPSTVKCLCHSDAHTLETYACPKHLDLMDLNRGGFKDA